MKKVILLFLACLPLFLFAQNKKIKKIKDLHTAKKYEKCVAAADKYSKKESKSAEPFYYAGFSYFELSKVNKGTKQGKKQFKSAMKYIGKASVKSKGDKLPDDISTKLSEFQKALVTKANSLYDDEKTRTKSKTYFQSMAKIFKDTTEQYREFYMKGEERPDAEIVGLMEKGELNVTDENGLKQGRWQKVYPTGKTAYEAFFKNGKPIGKLKRYAKTGELQVVLDYGKGGETASAIVYDKAGKVKADGFYTGKVKDKKWTYYYADGKTMRTEEYAKGKLNGEQKVFYPEGNVYEEKFYSMGAEDGMWRQYYRSGTKITQCKVVGGQRQGMFLRYFKDQRIQVKGMYVNDLPEGEWEFYPSESSKKSIVKYKNGVAENKEEIEDQESQEFLNGMKKGKDMLDPADFSNNPQDYIRKTKK